MLFDTLILVGNSVLLFPSIPSDTECCEIACVFINKDVTFNIPGHYLLLLYAFKALRITSPMGPADAGFWPVYKLPSTTT
jgi:hypothetical protein